MKLMVMNCPACGAKLEVSPELTMLFCKYCGVQIYVDDEVRRFKHIIEYGNAEDAGYLFEKGRQKAIAEAAQQPTQQSTHPTAPASAPVAQPVRKKKRNTGLWILGWIFIFPVPVTILMLNKKDMNPVVRYGIITIAWIVYTIWMISYAD